MNHPFASLQEFESRLPPAPEPVASYMKAVRVGDLIYTSGALPMKDGDVLYCGKLGEDMNIEDGQQAARLCCVNLLSIIKEELGSLQQVERIVKLTGYVHSGEEFTQHPQVINGASELLQQVFGDAGKHARTAVGMASLPLNAALELDLIVQVKADYTDHV